MDYKSRRNYNLNSNSTKAAKVDKIQESSLLKTSKIYKHLEILFKRTWLNLNNMLNGIKVILFYSIIDER